MAERAATIGDVQPHPYAKVHCTFFGTGTYLKHVQVLLIGYSIRARLYKMRGAQSTRAFNVFDSLQKHTKGRSMSDCLLEGTTEKEMQAEDRNSSALPFLRASYIIPSAVANITSCGNVGRLMMRRVRQLEFQVHWAEPKTHVIIKPEDERNLQGRSSSYADGRNCRVGRVNAKEVAVKSTSHRMMPGRAMAVSFL
ncbi:hypothetical protein PHLCEN_2v12869 [Hermanssonia centrifuga]|uniref:Uncharacterized protein n=1 Tax=Hermanssonia centrifuga TaxID=98765 RepID=A0A2R6NFQ4_9APHY|nr:hypothetical protein PHLCEN_2v12869 [Hermanssonia centrifuga]